MQTHALAVWQVSNTIVMVLKLDFIAIFCWTPQQQKLYIVAIFQGLAHARTLLHITRLAKL